MTTDAQVSPEIMKVIRDQVMEEVAKKQPGVAVDKAKLEEILGKAAQLLQDAGIPALVVGFLGKDSVLLAFKFSQPVPVEGQIDLAGRELTAIAERVRQARLAQQIKIN